VAPLGSIDARGITTGTKGAARSIRYVTKYVTTDGLSRKAPRTFGSKRSAERWLVETEWVRERDLKPRTREEYQRHLRLHVRSFLGDLALSDVSPAAVRRWRADRLAAGVEAPIVAKTYHILHAIFTTAVDDDELLRRNPCRVKGAGQDEPEERPMATLNQVFAIAAAIQPRYRLARDLRPAPVWGADRPSAPEHEPGDDGAACAGGRRPPRWKTERRSTTTEVRGG
jgi:hypothetical protein